MDILNESTDKIKTSATLGKKLKMSNVHMFLLDYYCNTMFKFNIDESVRKGMVDRSPLRKLTKRNSGYQPELRSMITGLNKLKPQRSCNQQVRFQAK